MEFKITPFEDALSSGDFERLCVQSYGESVMPLRIWPGYMMEVFEGIERVFFCTYWSKKRQAQIVNCGAFGEGKDRLKCFKAVVNYLHETGHDQGVFIEIPDWCTDQQAGVLECGFEPFGTRTEGNCTLLQFVHNPGGRADQAADLITSGAQVLGEKENAKNADRKQSFEA